MGSEVARIERGEVVTTATQYGIDHQAARFLADLKNDKTRRAYRRHLHVFALLTGLEDVRDITADHLRAWALYLANAGTTCDKIELPAEAGEKAPGKRTPKGGRYSPASQAQALVAVRSFLNWLGDVYGLEPIERRAINRTLRVGKVETQRHYNTLTAGEQAALFAAAQSPRDRAIVSVMMDAGLRVSEVVGLDVGDIYDGEAGMVLQVRGGKGGKDRTLPVSGIVARIIRQYLTASGRVMGDRNAGPLFSRGDRAGDGGRLTARAVGMLLARLVHSAGIEGKRISPHSLRHSYAMHQARAGLAVHEIQSLLGHASLQTTTLYLQHVEHDDLRERLAEPAYAHLVSA
jgi:site-specific recombinase XerD